MTGLEERARQLRERHGGQPVGPARNLAHIARQQAEADPDRVVIIDAEHRLTRAGMLDKALRLGAALRQRGIGAGAAVAFQLPNWWEACVINLACALYGYRLVPLLTIYRRAELDEILPACEVAAVFIPEALGRTDYPALYASLASPPAHIFTVRGEGDQFAALLQAEPGAPEPAPDDDAKMVLFTSGSTGHPKGVIHSHASIAAIIEAGAALWSIGPEDTFYVPSPIGHIGGSIYAFEFPWMTGCTTVLAERWDPDLAVREIEAHGATFMAGATPFLSGLIAAAGRAGTSLPSLRRFICGGASVPPELIRRGLDAFPGAVVSRAYGSSEIPILCPGIRSRDEAFRRADTDGEIAADLVVLDAAGRPVPEGMPGEIAAAADRMFLGYLNPADDVGAFTGDGRFLMGDLGRIVDGKYIQITGRTKDIIIRKGENISPLEIENALARHPALRQQSVVGVPDPERGEMVVAVVVPKEGARFTFADMIAHLEALGMAKQKFPERLEIVEALPMNSVGKVQKQALRATLTQTGQPEGRA
ncbi:AMP-binding protein [Sinisalibacter aestuarii]|uniref:Cyclohexanecarboxylate-CoA ligase n=1 Tax=Sinisalibacter aestuarii TaxID=2949426 RepID=A0ABQ5LZ95_9RHOB|nr:AMP-binding protein [Sinisalibacter aestuarii]GKY89973.1 cyclohexanecarboxylate-CoA ligase [Sinisalibacter aestuarii]